MNGAPSLDCCKASIFGSGKLSPQWRQKIALRAENKASPDCETIWDRMDFLHEVQFSAGIGPAHFLAETTRPLRYCLCAAKADPMNGAPSSNSDIAAFRRLPFSPSFISHICLPNGNGYFAENIVGRCPPFSDPVYFLHEVQFSAFMKMKATKW